MQNAILEHHKDQLIFWNDFPELAALCWNRHTPQMTEETALRLYETNWAFVNRNTMPPHEKEFVTRIAKKFGSYLQGPHRAS
ncbi:MAG: hypothetical protein A3F67_06395 [Verrucomicrobia bacterium RIFCSPHIGHO2_12_FULL_41_10]|nr:MAG: hypothetical protein A3F67_06395 [Verrucomicrobia bacterium RIFCSPHIGHO2_12_FULL_41_10]HLB34749.1 hypothetical protein [Chthoniobacterales bacterium]